MKKIATEAWVLVSGEDKKSASLVKQEFSFPDINESEVLLKPLYGCMEGNFTHALKLSPENIFDKRQEDEIVLGNSGVMIVERVGSKVSNVDVGDLCIYFCNGQQDEFGYPELITGYDKPNTIGVFAKKIKLKHNEVIKIPKKSKLSLQQWAAFSLKYITAWSNWHLAYKCWKAQMPEVPPHETYVFGWGGGVTFGELVLAEKMGCKCFLLTSKKERIELIRKHGITGIDRNKYSESIDDLIKHINVLTNGKGVSIFVDFIGQSVYKQTMKALGRQGVITTAGWKSGSMLPILRANECQQRHIHVFTHYARYQEGLEAIEFAEQYNWAPPISGYEYSWEEIPQMLEDYSNGKISSWFPIFRVNEGVINNE